MASRVIVKGWERDQEMSMPFLQGKCILDSNALACFFQFRKDALCVVQSGYGPEFLSNVLEESVNEGGNQCYIVEECFGDTVMVYGGLLCDKRCRVVNVDSESSSESSKGCNSTFKKILLRSGNSKLKKILTEVQKPVHVECLPPYYDGKVVFELPSQQEAGGSMDGMQQNQDPHMWTTYSHTNTPALDGTVRLSYCAGYLQCQNPCCDYLLSKDEHNSVQWKGCINVRPEVGPIGDEHGSVSCAYCKEQPYCIALCDATIYYCLPKCTLDSRLVIHTSSHSHPIRRAQSRLEIKKLKNIIENTPTSVAQMAPRQLQNNIAMEEICSSILLEVDVDEFDKMRPEQVDVLLLRLEPLCNQRR